MRILITGYGPFGDFAVNPSALVVHQLEQDNNIAFGTGGTDPSAKQQHIELVTRVIDVDYASALNCSNLARTEQNVDFAIHIGVYPGGGCVFLERRAFRAGYVSKDVNGAVPLRNRCELSEGEEEADDKHCAPPAAIVDKQQEQSAAAAAHCRYTVLDLDRLRTALLDTSSSTSPSGDTKMPALNIEISEDPGRYLCGYIYYCSLLNLSGRALFVHIPPFDDAQSHTAQLCTRLIKRLVVEVAKQLSGGGSGAGGVDAVAPRQFPLSSASSPPPLSMSSLISNGQIVSFPLGGKTA